MAELTGAIHLRRDSRAAGDIAYLTIERPSRLNALGRALMLELAVAIESLATEERLRVLVLGGAGERAFIGGADADEMARLDPPSAREFIERMHRCCRGLRELPVPAIARIQGYALGAGVEIAAACDLRVAAEGAVFGMPEVRLGMPSVVEAALLPGLVGWGRARQIMLLGETFSAALLAAAPLAVRHQKRLMRAWEELPLGAAIRAGVEAFAAAFETDEPRRRIAELRANRRARQGS